MIVWKMIWRKNKQTNKTNQKNQAAICSFINQGMMIEHLLFHMHKGMSELLRFCVINVVCRKSLDEELQKPILNSD